MFKSKALNIKKEKTEEPKTEEFFIPKKIQMRKIFFQQEEKLLKELMSGRKLACIMKNKLI